MLKIISIVGARPEFIQAAPVSRALKEQHQELLVHTGQHYDYLMSQAFFDDLQIPAPDYNLEVGSGSHGQQTAEILIRMEAVLLEAKPDLVIVRGDTNSTIGGALAAAKLQIPTAHIESGERSLDRRMPEEINRLVSDRIADLHFCVSKAAIQRLSEEGIKNTTHWVGDVMYDAMLQNREIAQNKSQILAKQNLISGNYTLVTIHRAANTDSPTRLKNIVSALNKVEETIVFPAHPRTRKALQNLGLTFNEHVKLIDPVGYFDMITLENNARLIATDSGGVQREAYFLEKPCLTLRDETEWTETITAGWNVLVGANPEQIIDAWHNFQPPKTQSPIFGHGDAGQKIAQIITKHPPQFGQAHQ